MHNLLPFLPIITLFLLAIFIFVVRIFCGPMRKKIKEFDGKINSKGEGVFSVDGKTVTIQYLPGSRSRSPEFRMSTPGSFGAELVIRTETSLDRFYKKIGLNSEVQISDQELDDKFYFECDVPEFLNQLLLKSNVKPLVLDVLTNFTSIEITQNTCTFKQYPSGPLKDISKENITAAARKLLSFGNFIPQVVDDPHPELVSFKMWRSILYFMGTTILIGGIASSLWASISYRIVDALKFWCLSAGWAFAFMFVAANFTFLKIKGFSTSARVFLYFLGFAGVGTLLLARFGGAIYNGIVDQSSVQKFEQTVIDKYTTTHKGSTTYHVVVEPWRSGRNGWEFTVGRERYGHIRVGATHYKILTKAGRFGFEWVISESLIDSETQAVWSAPDYSHWYPLPSNSSGMAAEEFAYWQKWCILMEEGITNRRHVQEVLDSTYQDKNYEVVYKEYRRRQQDMISRLSQFQPPERLKQFQEDVVNAGNDQIHFYDDYARAKMVNKNVLFKEFSSHADLKAGDEKLWAAYHYFQSLYPSIDKATNDAIEQRLAWFDII